MKRMIKNIKYKLIFKLKQKNLLKIFSIFFLIFIFLSYNLIFASDNFSSECGPIGISGYEDLTEYKIPEFTLKKGKIITVTTSSDAINGDVSSLENLLANPGFDGISLREAMKVTQRDPGIYTINFAEHLKGETIEVGSIEEHSLPFLKKGNVIINGDITGDNTPDITIRNNLASQGDSPAIMISSENNIINALKIEGFIIGIGLSAQDKENYDFTNNVISNNIMVDIEKIGVLFKTFDWRPSPDKVIKSNNKWINTTIINNKIDSNFGGVNFHVSFLSGVILDNTKIIGNDVRIKSEKWSEGISLIAGAWANCNHNKIKNTLILDNNILIIGDTDTFGIRIAAGDEGSSNNIFEEIIIKRNNIQLELNENSMPVGGGIMLAVGDGSSYHQDPSYRPIIYPEYNILKDVFILENNIEGFANHGIYIMSGIMGAMYNEIKDILITGNSIKITPSYIGYGLGKPAGIGFYSGPFKGAIEDWGGGRPSSKNTLLDIVIKWNEIEFTEDVHNPLGWGNIGNPPLPGKPYSVIFHEAENNYIGKMYLLNNIIIGKNILVNLENNDNVVIECNILEIYKNKIYYLIYIIILIIFLFIIVRFYFFNKKRKRLKK